MKSLKLRLIIALCFYLFWSFVLWDFSYPIEFIKRIPTMKLYERFASLLFFLAICYINFDSMDWGNKDKCDKDNFKDRLL
jgi:hypothetical protein